VAVRLDPETQKLKPETLFRKPWPDAIDEWTHWLHSADGNAVADDRVVGPPRHVQWVAPPQWLRHHEASPSVSAMVSSGGRLFAIINEAPAGIDGLPDRWAIVARDAFNGKLLWKRPIAEWGWSQWSDHSYGHGRWNHPTHIHRRMVAVGDRVYATLNFNAPLMALDAATGRTVMTYPETQFTDEILYHEGTLVLSVNTAAQGPGRLKTAPPVNKEVVALNAQTGDVLWRTEGFVGIASKADAIERITHLSAVLGGGKVFCLEENAVVALDMKTGKRLWSADRAPRQRPVSYGSYYFGNLCSMVYHDQIVLFMEPDPTLTRQPWNGPAKSTLLGISAETGEVVWTRDCGMWGHYNQGDVFIIDDLAWVHDGQAFSMLGLDPHTGQVKRTLATQEALDQGHHHRCYRNKATPRYIITGRRGVEFINIESAENQRHHWTRGTCRYGVLPCNGLLYVPPHPCVCYITAKLNGFWALAPKRQSQRREVEASKTEVRLDKGPAYANISHPASRTSHPDAWPTYRHDAARSGCAGTAVARDLMPSWSSRIEGQVTSPVIADGQVFLASPDTHTVWALGANDGKRLWSFTGDGRIDTPPTVHGGLALFGSADGWVYCLRASDGELVWRLRAAPDDSRIVADDRLESPWPVHGSVLIQDGVVYFAAGRSSFLDGGIYVYAVNPETGEVLRQQRIDSLDPETEDMVECRLPYDMPPDTLGALPDVFVGDGSNVYMRHLKFDTTDLSYASAAMTKTAKRGAYPATGGHLTSVAGLLDDNWFNQTYWTVDGKAHSKLLVFDDNAAFGVKPFPGNARHSRAIFRPGSKGYTLFANERPKHQTRWSIQIPVRIRAMVVAGSTLFVAGTPDVIDAEDPWSAIDGRKGGILCAISTADGKKLAEYPLKSPPVFDGIAAANGRLYISTIDGSVVCLAADSNDE
jgi:outer membrane protein assembly factor BamB